MQMYSPISPEFVGQHSHWRFVPEDVVGEGVGLQSCNNCMWDSCSNPGERLADLQ